MNGRIVVWAVGGTAMAVGMTAGGCAAGRTDDGSIVLGAKLAELPETAEEAAKLAAGFLGEPWSTLTKAAIGLIFGGGAAAIAARNSRQRENHAWDEAEARAYSRGSGGGGNGSGIGNGTSRTGSGEDGGWDGGGGIGGS